jgi:hypothetical protein
MHMEPRWNDDIDRGKLKNSEKTYPSVTFFIRNPIFTDTDANPGLDSVRPATNRLSHGTALPTTYLPAHIHIHKYIHACMCTTFLNRSYEIYKSLYHLLKR